MSGKLKYNVLYQKVKFIIVNCFDDDGKAVRNIQHEIWEQTVRNLLKHRKDSVILIFSAESK